jgi:hypothetical protein
MPKRSNVAPGQCVWEKCVQFLKLKKLERGKKFIVLFVTYM